MKTTLKRQKSVVTQAELQENTLQLESPQTEDTGMKQTDLTIVDYKPKTLKKMINQLKKNQFLNYENSQPKMHQQGLNLLTRC